MNWSRIVRAVLLPGLLSLLVGGLGVWGGYQYADKKATAAAAEAAAEAAEALAEANRRNRQLEKEHESRIQDLRAEFAAREAEARERDAAVISDLRDGTERLRFQVRSCRSARPSGAEAAAPGADGGGEAELAPETAAALWGIAGDGDAYARRLNALQDWARSALELCNGEDQ